ncbi:uncharacterized protein LOC131627443 [Vicia villosa]|uniref:uncharacterized protein LOC131627443 n=1 Tax=Vicia villosa TaxID=3911 RepID=UPI00273C4B1F|nr:uncharacterized protein LOC131627443 [Vicia villosa]
MRIRKNAKFSPLLHTCSSSLLKNGSFTVENFQAHVCQLNQSPWDVIPFHSTNSIQFEDEDTIKTGDFHRAFDESVVSMMDTEDADTNKHAIEIFNTTVLEEDNTKKVVNINNNGAGKDLKSDNIAVGPPRRGRGRPKKALGLSSNNNNDFYYYSGFGPLWGKRRGDSDNKNGGIPLGSGEDKVKVNVGVDVNVVPCYSENDIEELDYVDDYDDYDDNDNGKRRMRKPVKERSLKSLM